MFSGMSGMLFTSDVQEIAYCDLGLWPYQTAHSRVPGLYPKRRTPNGLPNVAPIYPSYEPM